MKRKTTIKGLLLAALLMGGVSSAWGDLPDDTFTVSGTEFTKLYSNDYESDQSATYGAGWAVTVDDAVTRSTATSGYALKTTVKNNSTATFTVADCANYPNDMTQSLFYVEMALHNRYYGSGRSVTTTFYSGENVLFTAQQSCSNSSSNIYVYDGTTSGTKISEISSNSNNSAVEAKDEIFHRYIIEYNGTETFLTITAIDGTQEMARTKLTNAGNVTKISTKAGSDQAERCRIFFDNMWIGTSTATPLTNHSYTINYKLNGEDAPVKTVAGVSVHNASIATEDIFFVGSQKYYRKAGEATSVTINTDNQVDNIAVRYAETWNYTVKQEVSSVQKGTKNGTFTEGESIVITWPRYVLDGTTLYDYSTSGSESYRTTVSPSDDGYGNNYILTKAYDAGTKTNVVLFKESDEIEGTTNGADTGGIGYRLTNGSAAKAASAVTAFSLPKGTYKIVAGLIGQSVNVTFTAGSTTIMSQAHSSNTRSEYESGIFKLSSTTEIKFTGSSTSGGLDYVYVLSASDEIAISDVDASGYTFSSKSALDFTGKSVEAYIAKYTSGDVVTLQRVYKVPANTGLIIKGSAGNVNVLAAGEATDGVTGNVLVAQTTPGTVAQTANGKTNYVLGMVNETPTFLKVPEAGVNVPEGKAYLSINYTAGSRLNIVFEDEATGIEAMHNAQCTMHNEMYDLQGRRVAQPSKGLYIVNGKKVVIK